MSRSLTLIAAAGIAAAIYALPAFAQSADQNAAPPADLHPPINLDADTLRARFASGHLGLKLNSTAGDAVLPYGIDYNRDTKSLIVPIDEKSDWGVGVGLNMNSSKVIELSPGSALGLQQPSRAPGLMLHRKF
jgi:hypothetical protein